LSHLFIFFSQNKHKTTHKKRIQLNLAINDFHKHPFLSLLSLRIIEMFVMSNEDNAGERAGGQIWDN